MDFEASSNSSNDQRATDSLLVDTTSVPFDFEVLWAEVEATCESILEWETSFTTSSTQIVANAVTRAYVLVYHLVSHPCLNTPRVHFEGKDLSEGQQALAVYLKLRKVLQNHLSKKVLPMIERSISTEHSTIETYVQQWRTFLVAVTNLKTIFSSLAPAWNSLGFEENPFERIEDIALNNWSEIILRAEIQQRLETELAACVSHERENEEAHREGRYVTELSDVLAMLPDQLYYKTIVENTYLTDLQRHFADKANKLSASDVYSYSVEALRCIESESDRASKYLKSKKLAIDQLVNILVDDNVDYFQTSPFADWMGDWKSPESREQIYSVYNLLSRSRRVGLPLLEERFTSSVVEMTAKEIRTAVQENGKDGYGSVIRAFLAVIKNLRDVVTDAFHEDACMVEAMENGLRHGLFAGGRGVVDYKSLAERLSSLSCGAFLPTEQRTQEQMSIEDIVCVYFFLPDVEPSAKEAFLVSYQKQLARRLLSGEYSPSLEQQALYLLAQVKQSPLLFACRTMVRAVNEGIIYRSVINMDDAEFRPAVLPKGSWPTVPVTSLRMPHQLASAVAGIELSTARHFPGQRIVLAPSLSYGVMKMRLAAGSTRSFVSLKLNLLQICITNEFNTKQSWSFAELCTATGCSPNDGHRALIPLAAAKVVQFDAPLTAATEVKLDVSPAILPHVTQLTLIPEGTQAELLPSPGTSDTLGTSAVSRLHPQAVETRVTRLLKADGPMSLDEIHCRVSAVLSPHPVARVDVKKALEKLVDRQFVVREETKLFKYLP